MESVNEETRGKIMFTINFFIMTNIETATKDILDLKIQVSEEVLDHIFGPQIS